MAKLKRSLTDCHGPRSLNSRVYTFAQLLKLVAAASAEPIAKSKRSQDQLQLPEVGTGYDNLDDVRPMDMANGFSFAIPPPNPSPEHAPRPPFSSLPYSSPRRIPLAMTPRHTRDGRTWTRTRAMSFTVTTATPSCRAWNRRSSRAWPATYVWQVAPLGRWPYCCLTVHLFRFYPSQEINDVTVAVGDEQKRQIVHRSVEEQVDGEGDATPAIATARGTSVRLGLGLCLEAGEWLRANSLRLTAAHHSPPPRFHSPLNCRGAATFTADHPTHLAKRLYNGQA